MLICEYNLKFGKWNRLKLLRNVTVWHSEISLWFARHIRSPVFQYSFGLLIISDHQAVLWVCVNVLYRYRITPIKSSQAYNGNLQCNLICMVESIPTKKRIVTLFNAILSNAQQNPSTQSWSNAWKFVVSKFGDLGYQQIEELLL